MDVLEREGTSLKEKAIQETRHNHISEQTPPSPIRTKNTEITAADQNQNQMDREKDG